jgi:hypothetical protein
MASDSRSVRRGILAYGTVHRVFPELLSSMRKGSYCFVGPTSRVCEGIFEVLPREDTIFLQSLRNRHLLPEISISRKMLLCELLAYWGLPEGA